MVALAQGLWDRDAGLQELYPGGGDVDTSTPVGLMVFAVMAALAPMALEFKRDRITDSMTKPRVAGKDLAGSSSPTPRSGTRCG